MKAYFFLVLGFIIFFSSVPALCWSQHQKTRECGTRTPLTPLIPPRIEHPQRNAVPYMMKIFVRIIADDNGSNVACGDSSLMRQLENMQEFYEPHSICFQLLGVDIINSSDLNSHNADTEQMDLFPHLIDDAMTIFVHWDLFNNEEDLNGSAYSIPNTYLSVSRGAITSIDNRSTLSHEMGHCFGLYHTFEVAYGEEEIPRSGDCSNCDDAGDYLCDTKADPHSDSYDTGDYINSSCNYTGSLTRECDDVSYTYDMDPHNIMAYGRRECRDLFTSGQGSRMNDVITTTVSLLNRVSVSSVTVNQTTNITTGTFAYGAQNTLTVQGNDFVVSGSANGFFNAAAVTLKQDVHFQPGTEGSCRVYVNNPVCD